MERHVLKKIKRHDRIARWVITAGGLTIIASVLLILFLITRVTLPLFASPQSGVLGRGTLPAEFKNEVLALGIDEYLEAAFLLTRQGTLKLWDPRRGVLIEELPIQPPSPGATVGSAEASDAQTFDLLWSDGSVTREQLQIHPRFDGSGQRSFERTLERLAIFATPAPPGRALVRIDGEGRQTLVTLLPGNRLEVRQNLTATDFLGNEETEEHAFALETAGIGTFGPLALDRAGHTLYAGTDRGNLLRWDLSNAGEPVLLDNQQAFSDGRALTALALVYGDISLAVGDSKGDMSTWFAVPEEGSTGKILRKIHTLDPHDSAILAIYPSARDKSLLSLDAGGVLHLDHMTSERHLLTLDELSPVISAVFAPRGNAVAALTADGQALLWSVDAPHPEISWKTLFGKVWYESYPEPAYAWQSSAGSDDFEPKMSLTPLIFGTLKGTFYAMLFAIPLALFGAIYTSQFGLGHLRQWIKPTVEIMAAIPSVVIGFLAALWFAPLLERNLTGLFLSLAFIPTTFVFALLLWQVLRRGDRFKWIDRGHEFLALVPVLVLAVAAAVVLGPHVEVWLFSGDFKLWLFTETGTRYDPRNSIVISFALGFAVIPIIFTIAEDALSNVPASLKAASLALGASRWQTVWRVILPSASPGIFAGIMIGLGRAIGETMIVLMATGNTPIIDWSLFNGMRPLSANIAVEIPEAPVGESLFRVLFLSAVILFALTFILNTVAEIVRQRLRSKYGKF
jgi:phosphate transport system permease protein